MSQEIENAQIAPGGDANAQPVQTNQNLNIASAPRSSNRSESSKSTFSDLSLSKGFIFQNPDGTVFHAKPLNNNVAKEEPRPVGNLGTEHANPRPAAGNFFPMIDDEVAFLGPIQDMQEYVDDVIGLYLRHQLFFFWILTLQLLLEVAFGAMSFLNRHETILEMTKIYEGIKENDLVIVFWTFFISDIAFSLVYYPLGYLALHKRSLKYFNWFSIFSLLGLIGEMLLAYINKFNLIVFFLRILSYIYAKFLSQLIISLLILPRYRKAQLMENNYNKFFEDGKQHGFKFKKTHSKEDLDREETLRKLQSVVLENKRSMPEAPEQSVSHQTIPVHQGEKHVVIRENTQNFESQASDENNNNNKASMNSRKTGSFVIPADEKRMLYKSQDTKKISETLVRSVKKYVSQERTKVSYELSRDIYSVGFCLYYKQNDFIPYVADSDILDEEKSEEVAHKLLSQKKIEEFIRYSHILLVVTMLLQLGSLILLSLLVIDDNYVKPSEKGMLLILSRLVVITVLTLIFYKNIQEAKLKMRFTLKQREKNKFVGVFLSLFQILVGICTQLVTVFTIMRSKDALQIFIDFAAFMVIIEIDDWVGDKFLLQKRKLLVQYCDLPSGISDIGSYIITIDIDERKKKGKDRKSILKAIVYQISNTYLYLIWILDLWEIYIYP